MIHDEDIQIVEHYKYLGTVVVLINDRSSLNNIVKTCSKIIGVLQRDLRPIWEEWTAQKAKGIIQQSSRVLHGEFTVLSS